MPQNILEPSLIWEPKISSKKCDNFYVKIAYVLVAKAATVISDEDYLAPPAAYQLLNANAGILLKVKQQKLNLGLSITNALNNSYRAYLNRYRYFADELGTNVSIHLKIPINFKQ
jgi:iron complex outermembrane receptor protein